MDGLSNRNLSILLARETPLMSTATPDLSKMAELNNRVAMALARNPYLTSRQLDFDADEQQVTLRGEVGSFFQKQMAQEMLRGVDGVNAIRNELEVVWT